MARVICDLRENPNASTLISGVSFKEDRGQMVSEETSEEMAALFASLPGFKLAPDAAAAAAAAEAAEREAEEAAEREAEEAKAREAAAREAAEREAAEAAAFQAKAEGEKVATAEEAAQTPARNRKPKE